MGNWRVDELLVSSFDDLPCAYLGVIFGFYSTFREYLECQEDDLIGT